MRRTASFVIGALTAAAALTGCSAVKAVNPTDARAAHGPMTIWYSNNPQEVAWGKQVVKAWNAQHAGEPVTGQEVPTGTNSEAVIQASIIAGTEPCLIYNTSPASVPTFQQIGGLVDLNQFPDGKHYIESRSGSAAAQYRSPDGDYYQMPWKTNPVMIFYSKKIFAKAGLDPNHPNLASYASFLAAARKVVATKAARYAIYPAPTSDFYQSWYDFYSMYAAQSGGQQLIENGQATFDDAAGRAVTNFWQQIYTANLAGKDAYTNDPFAGGTAAMAIVGPWAVATYKGKVDWGVVPVPTQSGQPSKYTFSDAKNVAMYASCKNRGTAWDFLKFSTSQAQDGTFLATTGQIPIRANVVATYASYFAKNPSYKTFATLAQTVVEVPNVPNSVTIWQTFRNAWSKSVIFGKANPDATLAATARSVTALVTKK